MNKLLKSLLCAGLVLGLAGCGSSGETGKTEEPTNSLKAGTSARQDLEIEETGWYLSDDQYPYVNYAMTLTNPNSDYYVALPQISVTSYDAEGAVLGSTETYLQPLEPGQIITFAFQADCNQQTPDKVEFKVINTEKDYSKVESTYKTVELETSNVNITNDGYWYKITGMVKNNTEKDTYNTPMVSVLFYKEGKLVGGTGTIMEDMSAGSELAFDTIVSQVPDYDEMKVVTYAQIEA